jgi:TRAP-type C4-dicarboxylate transport system substrate-binding protein
MSFAKAISVAGALMLGTALFSPLAAQQSLTLKSADVHPLGLSDGRGRAAHERKKLEAATEGRLTIQVYPVDAARRREGD